MVGKVSGIPDEKKRAIAIKTGMENSGLAAKGVIPFLTLKPYGNKVE